MRARASLFLLLLLASGLASDFVAAADSAVVLMYHRFGEDRYPSTSIRVDQFEAQLAHLAERDYQVIPLAQLLDALNNGTQLPERAVVITIDDAYLSVYEVKNVSNEDYKKKRPPHFRKDLDVYTRLEFSNQHKTCGGLSDQVLGEHSIQTDTEITSDVFDNTDLAASAGTIK